MNIDGYILDFGYIALIIITAYVGVFAILLMIIGFAVVCCVIYVGLFSKQEGHKKVNNSATYNHKLTADDIKEYINANEKLLDNITKHIANSRKSLEHMRGCLDNHNIIEKRD